MLRSIIGALLTVLVGLALWKSSWATPAVNRSYDALWRFCNRAVTNKVTLIMMDDESFAALHQKRGDTWDRKLHAQLLNKLAVDNCSAVFMDLYLGRSSVVADDKELVRAIKGHEKIALRAGYGPMGKTNFNRMWPILPANPFLMAARNHWGVSYVTPDEDGIVRHHWPFPSPGSCPSLSETAVRTAGADISAPPRERWLRFYGQHLPWTRMSYHVALKQPPNFFRNQIVFIGVIPKASAPVNTSHKFNTPYVHWTGQATSGADVVITEFLNLLNHESLGRSSALEFLALLVVGAVIGSVLPRQRFAVAFLAAPVLAVVVLASAVALTANSNYWFPWMLIVFGQLPVALVWAAVSSRNDQSEVVVQRQRTNPLPTIPGYTLVQPPIGYGAYGEVWLAQKKGGEWRAVKVVTLDTFENDRGPYDREYEGVSRYREFCDKHPGLLGVEFVSEKLPTHFYYIMELGDALESGWEKSPDAYKPKDLKQVRLGAPQKRLPIEECIRIGMVLSDTLDFIHRSGFTHRDIKPQNILFVNGEPKLADLGLITNIRDGDEERTLVGTPGYMPPAPEQPGTAQADLYALGMVLYVISTGNVSAAFPELPETLSGDQDPNDFFRLNALVLKACHPNPEDRFRSAREMYCALEQLKSKVVAA